MPTYENTTDADISIPKYGITLRPGKNFNLVSIPPTVLSAPKYSGKVNRVSEEPYYNPIISDELITFVEGDTTKEVNINTLETKYIELVDSTALFYVYINDINNTPPIRVRLKERVTILNELTINKLIIKGTLINTELVVIQKRNKLEEESWSKGISLETINKF